MRGSLHQIRALHSAFHRFEDAVAVVFMIFARRDNGLLADYAFALHLFQPAAGVSNKPMPPQKLYLFAAVILDADEVCKHEFS